MPERRTTPAPPRREPGAGRPWIREGRLLAALCRSLYWHGVCTLRPCATPCSPSHRPHGPSAGRTARSGRPARWGHGLLRGDAGRPMPFGAQGRGVLPDAGGAHCRHRVVGSQRHARAVSAAEAAGRIPADGARGPERCRRLRVRTPARPRGTASSLPARPRAAVVARHLDSNLPRHGVRSDGRGDSRRRCAGIPMMPGRIPS